MAKEIRDNFFPAARHEEETVVMISDILTAVIIFLMAVLILYPTTRALMKSWHDRQRRLNGSGEAARRR